MILQLTLIIYSSFLYCAELFITAISKVILSIWTKIYWVPGNVLVPDNTEVSLLSLLSLRISTQSCLSLSGCSASAAPTSPAASVVRIKKVPLILFYVSLVHEALDSWNSCISEVHRLFLGSCSLVLGLGNFFYIASGKKSKMCSSEDPQAQMQTYALNYCLV